jgi:hypothetical protein
MGTQFVAIILINFAVFETGKSYQADAPKFFCPGSLRQQVPLKRRYSSTKLTRRHIPEGTNLHGPAVRTSHYVFAQLFFLPLHFHLLQHNFNTSNPSVFRCLS